MLLLLLVILVDMFKPSELAQAVIYLFFTQTLGAQLSFYMQMKTYFIFTTRSISVLLSGSKGKLKVNRGYHSKAF